MSEPRPRRLGARALFEAVLDEGTFRSWDNAPLPVAADGSAYAAELAEAAAKAGTDESVITGEGRIGGRRVALIAGEFRFLAGSIGRTSAERVVLAFERATREGLPLFAAPSSGGTRMQEGTPAFVTMVKISAAVAAFKAAKLPYITYLRHPTTGGVFASWGSLGHVTVAEPGATIGFLGARVYEALYGQPFPEGVQTAENLYEHGLLDAVLPVEGLAEVAGRFLDLVLAPRSPEVVADVPVEPLEEVDAWTSIAASRRPDRPGVRELLRYGAHDVLPLFGTGAGEWDRSLFLALARFGEVPCVVLGQDRRRETPEKPLSPSGLRVARRGMRLATELDLPLVSIIDTSGAALSREAEEGGLAGEIARCLAELVVLAEPTLGVLLGQGTGGGALALMPADRVISAVPRHRPRSRAGRPAASPVDRPARRRHRAPHRGRAPRRRRRTGSLLPAPRPGHRPRARRAERDEAGLAPRGPPQPLPQPRAGVRGGRGVPSATEGLRQGVPRSRVTQVP